MRGEHLARFNWSERDAGSSPHARGALHGLRVMRVLGGIIPACAGSTTIILVCPILPRDHPRMRGEHTDTPSATQRDAGSSPHARGALVAVPLVGEQRGIIPACAGSTNAADVSFLSDGIIPACAESTTRCCQSFRHGGDHPRMRGEHIRPSRAPVVESGSSPHARGALISPILEGIGTGIIPACAGSTDGIGAQQR